MNFCQTYKEKKNSFFYRGLGKIDDELDFLITED